MREITFRAWDGKQMSNFSIEIDSVGMLPKPPLPAEGYPFKVLMQFTGLHDKNGKEIYEGDIVRMDGGTDEETICVVDWLDDGFVLIGEGYNAEHLYPQIRNGRSGEVIGNIYENPELLK